MIKLSFTKILTLIIVCFITNFSLGQKISQELKKKVEFIYELSGINLNESMTETIKLKKKLDTYNSFDQVTIYLLLIDLQLSSGETELAVENCKNALKISENERFESYTLNIKYYLAKAYVELNQIENALTIYNNLSSEMDKTDLSYIYNLMQVDFGLLNKKFDNNRKALGIFLRLLNSKNEMFDQDIAQNQKLLLNIAEIYGRLNLKDSSEIYLSRFDRSYSKNPDVTGYYAFKTKGNIYFSNAEYKIALENYDRCLAILNESYDYSDLELILRKSQSFFQLGEMDSTRYYLKKITDTEEFKNRLPKRTLGEYYKLNAEIYQELGDQRLADSYFKEYVETREEFNKIRFKAQEDLNQIKTQEILAKGEQAEKTYRGYIISISSVLGFLLIASITFYSVKTRKDKKRFGELMATVKDYEQKKQIASKNQKVSIVEELPRNVEKEVIIKERQVNKDVVLDDDEIESHRLNSTNEDQSADASPLKNEKIQELLKKLNKLKANGYFLRQDSSLYNTAKRLKTNTSYLSSVINNTMNTNFNRFVNDIRMDYVILELKNNKRMRSYSVKGIAEEIGYKSADSFAKYFKESTGLSPSAFIRNLNKEFKI